MTEFHNPKGRRWAFACEAHPVCAVYVARYADGLFSFQRFMASVARQSGRFGLFIVYKGFPNIETMRAWNAFNPHADFTSTMMADYGWDLTAYRLAAERVEVETLVFFNTSTELVHPDCIARLAAGLAQFEACGAFGSWESFNKGWLRRLLFPSFPNPHVRTNAFAVRRELFLALWPKQFFTKLGCRLWESGYQGFSRRVRVGVANAAGVCGPMRFNESGFRFNNSLLLALDDRARQWDEVSPEGKQLLQRVTWEKATEALRH